jgi:subtilisin family serine protease
MLASSAVFAADTEQIVPGRYLVTFKAAANLKTVKGHANVVATLQNQLEKNLQATKKSLLGKKIDRLWICNAIAVSLTEEEANRLKSVAQIASVKPVMVRRYVDPDLNKKTVKYDISKLQWSVEKVKAHEVWAKWNIDGTGVVVGHLDTGIAADHPLLKDKTLAFKDFTTVPQEQAYDDQGHGTHTAGSIAADSGVGVAPGAKLIVAKVFDRQGSSSDEALLGAMQWVMDPDGNPETKDGPMLVSNSWGSTSSTDVSFWDSVSAWVAAGIVPVFAAGNSGPSGKVGSPGSFPHSWAVAATTNRDAIAYFSSVGPVVWNGETLIKPDIAAPGYGVISCNTTGGLVSNSGTSMACPHVSGLVALMLQGNPALTIDEVRTIAESTAIDLGTAGKDNKFGHGRFDAMACLEKVMAGTSLATSFTAYEASLAAEKALIGVQAETPLSGPLAQSLVKRTMQLDAGEFASLKTDVLANGGEAAKALLHEAMVARTAAELQK